MNIPDGVRLCETVPDAECNTCKLTTEDHTVNLSFPMQYTYGLAYLKVCLKDWAKYNKKEVTAMTMETPKETNEAKVEIIADGKVITPKKVREELRINLIIRGDHIFIGAQATDTDPKMTTLQGNLAAALARIPSFVEESNNQWDVAAHNPKAPEPVVPAAPTRTATTSSAIKPAPAKKETAQPNFF